MRVRRRARGLATAAAAGTLSLAIGAATAGPTNLDETTPLVWVMVAISIAGALVTWGIMVYALGKFRDPATRRRKYG